jgi:cyclomaltodextrinase / maltogenic alpha-amylase / neopullulanase
MEKLSYPIPTWAKDAIWYQIFPERFRNGDPRNDPKVQDLEEEIPGWHITPWGRDWYSREDWEKKLSDNFFISVYKRRYGGDLQGIINKLDYLQDLGITAIYLNPIFPASTDHKFNATCLHHVDENFGPDPEGDRKLLAKAHESDDPQTWIWTKADDLFLQLVKKAHELDMRIILDGVFNHSGKKFFAFQDILLNKQNSVYKDWYNILRWDDSLPDGFEYMGWYGYSYLPEFKTDRHDYNPGYKNYLFNVTRRWMLPLDDPSRGIDGWNLEVAFNLPDGFWRDFRALLRDIRPDCYITGEVCEIDPAYLNGDNFNALMNYPFTGFVTEFFINKKTKASVREFDNNLRFLRDSYPEEMNFLMQNLLSSHDTARIRTLILNPDLNYFDFQGHFQRSQVEHNHDYRIDRGTKEDMAILKLIVIFQMTYVGAPMIYYGDEVGMVGANDPDCRKPMLWSDLAYEDEVAHPINDKHKIPEPNSLDIDLLNHFRLMIKIRNDNPALRRGNFNGVYMDDSRDIYGYAREYQDEVVVVVINNSWFDQDVELNLTAYDSHLWKDLLNYEKIYQKSDEYLRLKIRPKWAAILKAL